MTEKTLTLEPGDTAKITLPHGIGYVEIRTSGTNGTTGYPTIGVEVISETTHTPAADGRLYSPVYSVRDDTVVLVGEPGPRMLEQQRQVKWFEKVITMHDSGDHSACPETCPAKAADVPRETSEGTCTEGARRPQCYPFHTDDCPYA